MDEIAEVLKFDPGRKQKPPVDEDLINEVLQFDPGRIGGTFQPKPSPVPGGTPPISAITGQPETQYVPGQEPSAGLGTLAKVGFVDDPKKQIEIYAEARGIPTNRYRVFNGEILFRTDDGKWQRETGEAPISLLKRGLVQTATNPAVGLGTAGAFLAGAPGAALGAVVGETGRQYIGRKVYGETQDPVSRVGKVAGEGVLALLGEGAGGIIKSAILGHRIGQTGLKAGKGALRVANITPEDHIKAQMMVDLARENGIDLPLPQAYDKESLTNFWMYLRKHPVTSDRIKEIESQLGKQGDEAMQAFVERTRLGPPESPVDIGEQLKGASTRAIQGAEASRAEAVYPIYQEAFKAADEAGGVDLTPVVKQVDRLIDSYNQGPAKKILQSVKSKLGIEENVKIAKGRTAKRNIVQASTKPMSFRNYVREMGGIAIDDPNYAGEIRDIFKGAHWGPGVVSSTRKGGIQMDELLSRIREGGQWHGMIETENDVLEALTRNPTNAGVGARGATEDQFSEAARQYAEDTGRVRERSEWKPTIKRVPSVTFTPEKDLRKIQKALFEINDIIEGTAHEAGQISPSSKNVLTRDLMSLKTQILEQVNKVSPDFLEANARFAELSEPIDSLKRSVIGELSRLQKDRTTAEATRKLFDVSNMKDSELLWRARASIEPQDPTLWRRAIASYLTDEYERMIIKEGAPLIAFGGLERKLFGSPRQREIMASAMGPDLFKEFSGLMTVLKRATVGTRGQSMTAQFQAMERELSPFRGARVYDWATRTRESAANAIFGRWNDMVLAGRQNQMLDAMLSEDAVKALSKLKPLTPGSRKLIDGLSAYTALISDKIGLGDIGNRLPEERQGNQRQGR